MREIWNEFADDHVPVDRRGSEHEVAEYETWREIFDSQAVIFDDNEETEHFWEQFLRAFYVDPDNDDAIRRDDYYDESGIAPSGIDWEAWREAKGYKRRKK
jgi:hypothetical protein